MRRQITLVTVAATAMVVLSFLAPLAVLVRRVIEQNAIDEANSTAQSLVPAIVGTTDAVTIADSITRVADVSDGRISVYLADGSIAGDAPFPVRQESLALARSGRAFTQSYDGGVEVFLPVIRPDASGPVVRVVVPDDVLRRDVTSIWLLLGTLGFAMVVVSGFVADRIARSVVRPLAAVSVAARRLASGDVSARAQVTGTGEVKLVAGALNALADRVSTLLQEERESMADLSHELRTPVTALRLAADQIHDPRDAQRMNELIGRVEDAITQLIERARNPKRKAESGDLVTALAERLAFWAVLAKAQFRPVRVTIEDYQLPVRATPSDLDVTIDALIGNVFAHTPGGCGFDVRAERHNRSTRLVVDDSGPGIGHHVRRGISTAPSSGTGLGLDIARRVAERSGGKLTVGRSPTGGARIVVEFGVPASSLP